MLWNPKHTPLIVAYDLPMIIKFLKEMNPKEEYVFTDCTGKCLFSRYMVWLGYRDDHVDDAFPSFNIWRELNRTYGQIAAPQPHTFGAALKRAKMYGH